MKKKVLFCVNHAAPFHVGGSEKVVQQISSSMQSEYNLDCHILTKFTHQNIVKYNNIYIEKCQPVQEDFLKQIEDINPDYILTYSDCFSHWPTLLREAENIRARQSIALVGMNFMNGDQFYKSMFLHKHKMFNVITHSDNYSDYFYCVEKNIPVNVIPNGINLNEFIDQGISFREKYNITTEKIILCVSNFFPGKGQEHLLYMLNKLGEKRKDFTVIFICTNVSFFVANNLMLKFESLLGHSNFQFRFLKNINRSDTVQAFIESDVFAFPSQQEVAPLVILEAMVTKTPWVSLNVGNVPDLPGGIVIKSGVKHRGQYQYNEETYNKFIDAINVLLDNLDIYKDLQKNGFNYIEEKLNWADLKNRYYEVITKK